MIDLRESFHSSVPYSLFRISVSSSEFLPSSAPQRENTRENVGENKGENDRFYANDFCFFAIHNNVCMLARSLDALDALVTHRCGSTMRPQKGEN